MAKKAVQSKKSLPAAAAAEAVTDKFVVKGAVRRKLPQSPQLPRPTSSRLLTAKATYGW